MHICILTLPINAQGYGKGGGSGPEALVASGLCARLEAQGHTLAPVRRVSLTREEDEQYGGWNRVGLAGAHLAREVSDARREDAFVLGLLADCNGVLGVLGGLQKAPAANPRWVRRVGVVYVDAHGDYNTPETSPSGMLGGMPVAVAAGKALHNLRKQNSLNVPLQSPDIVLAGLRDLDPGERRMIEEDDVETMSERDLIDLSPRIRDAMERLSEREDVIYVHVDLDILDPRVAPAAGLPSPGGLTGKQLGAALRVMLSYPKVRALAFVSYRADQDVDGLTRQQVVDAILEALK